MIRLLQVLGGLALFLFGVRMLSGGMEKLAGNRLQDWLDRMTNRPIKGAAFGAVATALIQSSSLLMVTMIGLINANLMTLQQAVGVMMGQEIGTTLTAQIVAFKIGDFSFLFIALGFALLEFAPRLHWHTYGEIALGFGILFLGMQTMSGALKVLAQTPAVEGWLASMGQSWPLGILAGTVATAVVQSSSAVTGLVVAMGISQVITLPGAIALLLGANIGTCVTGFIASLRLSRVARRASIAQILINVTGVVLFVPFIPAFAGFIARTSSVLPRQIANAHTVFNVVVSVILFPFVKQLTRVSEWLVPKRSQEEEPKLTKYIDERLYRFPAVALTEAGRELDRIGAATLEMVALGRQSLLEGDMNAAERVQQMEREFVDPLCATLENFVNVMMQSNLTPEQQNRCFQLKNLITDIERVGDLSENLIEAAQGKHSNRIWFSAGALEDLDRLFDQTHEAYELALQSFRTGDRAMAQQACHSEDEVDRLYWKARQSHIERLEAGVCQPRAIVTFIESLRNLERIGDHADNLGLSVMNS